MRKELFVISLILAGMVSALSYGSEVIFLAFLSLVPLIYGYWKGKYAVFFPIILGTAFVINSFTYPWDTAHILYLSTIWPGIFATFALHSLPESPEMEKNTTISWFTISLLSAGALYFIPAMVGVVENTFILAIVGLIAGLALAYLAWE
jgi:hypothetical protein